MQGAFQVIIPFDKITDIVPTEQAPDYLVSTEFEGVQVRVLGKHDNKSMITAINAVFLLTNSIISRIEEV